MIVINAASILVTRETRELLSRYNVGMNAADVTEVPADAELMIENGKYEITGSTVNNKSFGGLNDERKI